MEVSRQNGWSKAKRAAPHAIAFFEYGARTTSRAAAAAAAKPVRATAFWGTLCFAVTRNARETGLAPEADEATGST